MTKAVTLKDKKLDLQKTFERYEKEQAVTPRTLRGAMMAITRTPRLLDCTRVSLLGAIMQGNELELSFDPYMNEAHLVPYNNKKTGKLECQFQVGYKGVERLCRNSGEVVTIEAEVVREKDKYEYELGLHETLKHIPCSDKDAGEIIGTYAIATLRDASKRFKWLWRWQLDAVKNMSPSARAGAGSWIGHFAAMCEKTAKKRMGKDLPMSVKAQRAIALDDMADAGIPQGLEILALPEIEKPANSLDDFSEKLDPKKEVKAETKVSEDEPAHTEDAAKPGADTPSAAKPTPGGSEDDAPEYFMEIQRLVTLKKPPLDEVRAALAASDYDHIADNLKIMPLINAGSYTKIKEGLGLYLQWRLDGKPGA